MKTHNIPFFKKKKKKEKKKIALNYPKSAASSGLRYEFETAVVNEPSVFEPSRFYCNS